MNYYGFTVLLNILVLLKNQNDLIMTSRLVFLFIKPDMFVRDNVHYCQNVLFFIFIFFK